MTLPNVVTLFRLAAIPFVFALWLSGARSGALLLLTVGLFSDFADGYFARRLGQVTVLGAVLDPVADKANVITFFSYLYLRNAIPGWLYGLTLLRNVSQLLSIPVLSWILKTSFNVRPKRLPKWATATSFVILLLGMASLAPTPAPQWLPSYKCSLIVVYVISAAMETQILVTFLPRFYQIARGTHDTFE